jgi:hypothetical protein
MLRRLAILLLLALSACRTDAAKAPSADLSPTGRSHPADTPRVVSPPVDAEGYLVWWADSASAVRTVWLDAAGRTVAERPGLYVADGARLWRWEDGKERAAGADCECIRRKDDPRDCPPRISVVNTAAMVDLADGGRVEIMSPIDSAQADGEAQPQQKSIPVTGAGPYLLVRTQAAYDACGAHGLPADDVAWSSLTGDTLPHLDEHAVMARDSAAAELGFLQTPCGIGEDDEVRDPGQPWGHEAQWTRACVLQGGYRFLRSSAFICGDWGESYARTVLVADSVMPSWLVPWSRAPEPVRRYWRTMPRIAAAFGRVGTWASDTTVGGHDVWYAAPALRTGWSAVAAADTARLLALFRKR